MSCDILVVDDDDDIREMVRLILESRGYAVTAAANGAEALAQLRGGERPRLILLDLMMPAMNGWQFLEERARDDDLARIPVLAITGNEVGNHPEGVAALLRKPFDLSVLFEAVLRHCEPRMADDQPGDAPADVS